MTSGKSDSRVASFLQFRKMSSSIFHLKFIMKSSINNNSDTNLYPCSNLVTSVAVLTFPSRLARRGGVKRISATIYDDTRAALKKRLIAVRLPSQTRRHVIDLQLIANKQILTDCVVITDHCKRKSECGCLRKRSIRLTPARCCSCHGTRCT